MGLRRIISRIRAWREKPPAMIGVPPSARQISADPGLHALDFSHRYAEPMDYHVEQRMTELGIPDQQIGSRVPFQGRRHAAFVPHEKTGGGNEPGGKLVVDSGVFNTDLLKTDYGPDAGELFERSRLRDRLDAIIAHEYEEYRNGRDHEAALKAGPLTGLPITHRAREILRAMEKGWKGR